MAENLIGKYVNKDYFYFVFRVFVGLLFLQHGLQKLFGLLGGYGIPGTAGFLADLGFPVPIFFAYIAGGIELIAGLAIALGIFTRLGATLAAIEMPIAYFMAHVPNGLIPIVNQGELALLYFAAFLVIIAFGARKWSLEKAIFKKEVF